MVNLPGSRKVNGQKSVEFSYRKALKHQSVTSDNFQEVLLQFLEYFHKNQSSDPIVSHQNLSRGFRQLLGSLKSILNKDNCQQSKTDSITSDQIRLVVETLNILQEIYSDENFIFPETITLAAICLPFLLLNFLVQNYHQVTRTMAKRVALVLNFYFIRQENPILENDFTAKIQSILVADDDKVSLLLIKEIETIPQPNLRFRHAALFYGLLNCEPILQILLEECPEAFVRMFPCLFRICSDSIKIHEFHLFRSLNQYLKVLVENRKLIASKIDPKMSFCEKFLADLLPKTMIIIDCHLESPINGVIGLMKESYQYLIRLISPYHSFRNVLIEQFKSAIDLPFTSKAKYKKLSVLNQILGPDPSTNALCLLPFDNYPNFALQVLKHLSINSLSSAIAEYYKSSITFIHHFIQSSSSSSSCSELWSKLWLQSLVYLFESDLIQIPGVQNCLAAHMLPITIKTCPNSIQLLWEHLQNCSYGQVSLVRIFLEKSGPTEPIIEFPLPEPSWLLQSLCVSNDMIRAEALALLVGERFFRKNERIQICKLVYKFLLNNLNVDNATFRQRIICLLEQFYQKIIIGLCDRYNSGTELKSLPESQRFYLKFLSDSLDLFAVSLCPGSSFQRKFTSLNLIGSISEVIQKEDRKSALANLFAQQSRQQKINVPIQTMLLYGLIDKDDKIRRLCLQVLLQLSRASFCNPCFNDHCPVDIQSLSTDYIQSFRHQECHIGGLLYKYSIQSEHRDFEQIIFAVEKAYALFHSEQFRQNLLKSSRTDPLHGWLLALNQCCTYEVFQECSRNNKDGCWSTDSCLREKIFRPTIEMCLNSLEYFLRILTPNSNNDDLDVFDMTEPDQLEFRSPSFLEMCQSIRQLVRTEQNQNSISGNDDEDDEDFSTSNEFQLILSMCWLNLKESCFLLANLTSLYADLLCSDLTRKTTVGQDPAQLVESQLLISAEELYQIGHRIAQLMQKCRHKGVIEASGVAMTRYTRAFLRIQYYLNQTTMLGIPESVCIQYGTAMKRFIEEILVVIQQDQKACSSITRRSAGLALIVQSVLIGEAESIHMDGIKKPFCGDDVTLYQKFISLLMQVSQQPIFETDDNEMIDLPQANALHVLRSIIGTSALSQLSCKTVVDLLPICIHGFQCYRHWQIRNASLQLFGACVQRMLGQKKRPFKSNNHVDLGDSREFTITFEEFNHRYPSILSLICEQFESKCSSDAHRPEMVPVLALLASFTPALVEPSTVDGRSERLKAMLIRCLHNRCWKIRMLAAKSLSNLLPINGLESFIVESLKQQPETICSNQLHGLICCAKHLLDEIKTQNHNLSIEDYARKMFVENFSSRFDSSKCQILMPLVNSIFFLEKPHNIFDHDDDDDDDEDSNVEDDEEEGEEHDHVTSSIPKNSMEQILSIKANVSFKQPDNVRLKKAKQLQRFIVLVDIESIYFMVQMVSIIINLFEDEDRLVRLKVQNLATKQFRQKCQAIDCKTEFPFRFEYEAFCQNVSIDCFLHWLRLSRPDWLEILFKLFCKRLTESEDYLNDLDQNHTDPDVLLFEKEEKNVFAEPYLMNVGLVTYMLDYRDSHKSNPLLTNQSKSLRTIVDRFHDKFNSIKPLLFQQNLMSQSIWRLPKCICFMVNLYLSCKLVICFFQNDDHHPDTYGETLLLLEQRFPFLAKLSPVHHSSKQNQLINHHFDYINHDV